MKHIFVINPVAGFENAVIKLSKLLEGYKSKYDILIHVTTREKDAREFSYEYATTHPNEEIRFYSCGGDGTLGEVVNGIVGLENASITCFPCGSGNDFVKSVGGKERFLDLDKLFNAKNHKIDLIKVNDYYSLNVTNVGLDARACKFANALKGKTKNPYTLGIIRALFTGLTTDITIEVDGEVINPCGKLTLTTFANGGYMGGKYFCAPNYKVDDGIIEFCYISPVSIITLARLIKKYEKGKHLEDKSFEKYLTYKQIKSARLYSNKEFDLCVDGEMFVGKEFSVEIVSGAINFALPE
ncbi:MAG: hypothetical protein IKL82_05650 [Clostridia bacterium]|nr:hypothetical protein [Clostridia bacterium]